MAASAISCCLEDTAKTVQSPCGRSGGDHRSAVFVAGSSRSGTTWLADVLNYRNDFRYVHEPLGPGQLASMAHYRSGQYLRPDKHAPRYVEPMRAVLSGRVRGRALDRYNRKLVATKRLVKDVDANLLLGGCA